MRFITTKEIPTFGGSIPAGAEVFMTTGMIYRGGTGVGPIFVDDCLQYIDATPLTTANYRADKNPPWIGPDATVKVPEFVPAPTPVEAKPPIGGDKQPHRHAIKPAAGQGGLAFDDDGPVQASAVDVPANAYDHEAFRKLKSEHGDRAVLIFRDKGWCFVYNLDCDSVKKSTDGSDVLINDPKPTKTVPHVRRLCFAAEMLDRVLKRLVACGFLAVVHGRQWGSELSKSVPVAPAVPAPSLADLDL